MTGSRQVAKPAHCRPLPAGRGQTIAKKSVKLYHSQIVQMGGSRIMRKARLFLHWLCRPLRAGRGREMLSRGCRDGALNRWNFKLPA